MEKLDKEANLMASNQEKFRTITIGNFQIKDSLEHVPSSLDALMTDLCKDETLFLFSNNLSLTRGCGRDKR